MLDVLNPAQKQEVITWFIDLQLRDYRSVFSPELPEAWVDKIDRRFAWVKRNLASFAENCGDIFPVDWRMAELISVRFCEITHSARIPLDVLTTLRFDPPAAVIFFFLVPYVISLRFDHSNNSQIIGTWSASQSEIRCA